MCVALRGFGSQSSQNPPSLGFPKVTLWLSPTYRFEKDHIWLLNNQNPKSRHAMNWLVTRQESWTTIKKLQQQQQQVFFLFKKKRIFVLLSFVQKKNEKLQTLHCLIHKLSSNASGQVGTSLDPSSVPWFPLIKRPCSMCTLLYTSVTCRTHFTKLTDRGIDWCNCWGVCGIVCCVKSAAPHRALSVSIPDPANLLPTWSCSALG